MALDANELEAQSYGFKMPEGLDEIKHGDDAIRTNAVKAIEFARRAWLDTKTFLTEQSNLDTVAHGAAAISNVIVAKSLSAPDSYPGLVITYPIGSAAAIQSFMSLRGGTWTRRKTSSTWGEWEKDGVPSPETLTSTSSLDAITNGAYLISNTMIARDVSAPDTYPGIIVSYPVGDKGGLQTFTSLRGGTWTRSKVNGVWGQWYNPLDSVAQTDLLAPRREMLRQSLSARKGGVIGTSGRGVIALRFDDAPADFREKALPHLQRLNLPFTRVTTSDRINQTVIDPSEFALMQEYSLSSGGEVWNHGKDHLDATAATMKDNIVGALTDLRAKMPLIPVDCFAPPGGSSITYAGNMPSNTVDNWATDAGALIMGNHALVSGYFQDSYYRPLDGRPRDGQNHYSVDSYDLARAKQLVDRAESWKKGVVLMWHMNNVGTSGYMSMNDFVAALEYIAAARDAGKILVLTKSGMSFADVNSAARDDLLTTHDFNSAPTVNIQYPQYRQGVCGSTRELTATVNAPPGVTVTSTIAGQSKNHIVPAGGVLELRHLVTIPLNATSLSVAISAPAKNVHCYAI